MKIVLFDFYMTNLKYLQQIQFQYTSQKQKNIPNKTQPLAVLQIDVF